MSEQAVAEYAVAIRGRYAVVGRAEKGRILDEFCATTGMHRKAAIRLLNRKAGPAVTRRGRPRRYGPEVAEVLVKLWRLSDRMCGKLLAAVMPDLIEALERHGELQVTSDVRASLLTISAATIDRRLTITGGGLGCSRSATLPVVGSKRRCRSGRGETGKGQRWAHCKQTSCSTVARAPVASISPVSAR